MDKQDLNIITLSIKETFFNRHIRDFKYSPTNMVGQTIYNQQYARSWSISAGLHALIDQAAHIRPFYLKRPLPALFLQWYSLSTMCFETWPASMVLPSRHQSLLKEQPRKTKATGTAQKFNRQEHYRNRERSIMQQSK